MMGQESSTTPLYGAEARLSFIWVGPWPSGVAFSRIGNEMRASSQSRDPVQVVGQGVWTRGYAPIGGLELVGEVQRGHGAAVVHVHVL
eukprot:3837646-Pyramimonas_sp.AAC.1